MARSLFDERTVENGSQLVEARRPSRVLHDGSYSPQGRRHTVSQSRHVEARGMAPLILSRYTIVSALGKGLDETYWALRNRRSGLRPCDFEDVGITTHIGRVDDVDDVLVGGVSSSTDIKQFDCRNNRLALLGLQQD